MSGGTWLDRTDGRCPGLTSGARAAALLEALRRLDDLIRAAVAAIDAGDGTRAQDRFRGLYVGPEDVARLLRQDPGSPPALIAGSMTDAPAGTSAATGTPLAWLQQTFDLTDFDLDLLLIALAPEVDLRYERLFGFLQDDLTRRRPSVDLALDLLCGSVVEKIQQRGRLSPDASLLRHGLISLEASGPGPRPPLLAHLLVPDEQMVRFLLEGQGLDRRLAGVADLAEPPSDHAPLSDFADVAPGLGQFGAAGSSAGRWVEPPRLYFRGSHHAEHRRAAAALASTWHQPLLRVDLDRAMAGGSGAQIVRLALRDALFQDAVAYLAPLEALGDERSTARRDLVAALAAHPGPVVVGGTDEWVTGSDLPLGVVSVAFQLPSPSARRRAWQQGVTKLGAPVAADGLDALAVRYRLDVGQISAAVEMSRARLRWTGANESHSGVSTTSADEVQRILVESARAQTGIRLDPLAQRIPSRHDWGDLVLPRPEIEQLRDLCSWIDHRQTVLQAWGFARHVPAGGGITALFAGPPGTGKTLAAEVVAGQLGHDLYRVDLAQVVSKYIGETEKNLDAVFAAAGRANVVLLFDEADALFGKRSPVHDAHDRYANLEVAYLLQKMEEFEGLAILSTNLRDNLDHAFLRRLDFVVCFPFPDEASRRRIWRRLWPDVAPRSADIDIDVLATEVALSGGHLRNVAVSAAHRAAQRGGPIGMADVGVAVSREYGKLGRVPPALAADAQASAAVRPAHRIEVEPARVR